MTTPYTRMLAKIRNGEIARSELTAILENVERSWKNGALTDAQYDEISEALDQSPPADKYILFMGFCPNADINNRLDIEWKEKNICMFDWDDSPVQMERFANVKTGDLVVLRKREQFGKTMKLFGHGRVDGIGYDNDGRRYLKMQWSDQNTIIETPLLACNSTVNIKAMADVEREMPPEFFDWIS